MQQITKSEKLLTELEIKNLLIRERYYRDTKQWDKSRGCYHSDASKTRIKITWFEGDIDGFVVGSQKMAQGSASSAHTICPVELHLNGDKAVSESTGTILARIMYDGTPLDCISSGRFISCLQVDRGEWKMCTLEVIYDKDSLVPVTPGKFPKEIELDPNMRASYRCLGWVLAQSGFAIDQELPGTDRPGSGEALMEKCFEWLRGDDRG